MTHREPIHLNEVQQQAAQIRDLKQQQQGILAAQDERIAAQAKQLCDMQLQLAEMQVLKRQFAEFRGIQSGGEDRDCQVTRENNHLTKLSTKKRGPPPRAGGLSP